MRGGIVARMEGKAFWAKWLGNVHHRSKAYDIVKPGVVWMREGVFEHPHGLQAGQQTLWARYVQPSRMIFTKQVGGL